MLKNLLTWQFHTCWHPHLFYSGSLHLSVAPCYCTGWGNEHRGTRLSPQSTGWYSPPERKQQIMDWTKHPDGGGYWMLPTEGLSPLELCCQAHASPPPPPHHFSSLFSMRESVRSSIEKVLHPAWLFTLGVSSWKYLTFTERRFSCQCHLFSANQ